jgi:hypothetical protein
MQRWALALGIMTMTACVNVEGGAVELAWTIHDSQTGQPVSCSQSGIGQVVLHIDSPSVMEHSARKFACDQNRGSSFFDITPSPTTSFAIDVRCDDTTQATPNAMLYLVPQPIVREVTSGEMTDLDVLLITVPPTGKCPW